MACSISTSRLLLLGCRAGQRGGRLIEGGLAGNVFRARDRLGDRNRLSTASWKPRRSIALPRPARVRAGRAWLDDEQDLAGLDRIAVVILDLLYEALHARHERRGVDRRRIAGRKQVTSYRLLQRQRPARPSAAAAGRTEFLSPHAESSSAAVTALVRPRASARTRVDHATRGRCRLPDAGARNPNLPFIADHVDLRRADLQRDEFQPEAI